MRIPFFVTAEPGRGDRRPGVSSGGAANNLLAEVCENIVDAAGREEKTGCSGAQLALSDRGVSAGVHVVEGLTPIGVGALGTSGRETVGGIIPNDRKALTLGLAQQN